jgi:A/G-specific adenine glycosylase
MIKGTGPAAFNQAIMNFGAMQCRPGKPDCMQCTLASDCFAFQQGMVEELPVRKEKKPRRQRYFHCYLIHDAHGLIIHHRTGADIWQRMYDLPLLESKTLKAPAASARAGLLQMLRINVAGHIRRIGKLKQLLTHQEIHCTFYEVAAAKIHVDRLADNYHYVSAENLRTFAFPGVIRTFLSDNSLHLVKTPAAVNI